MAVNVSRALVAAVTNTQTVPNFAGTFFGNVNVRSTRYVDLQKQFSKARVAKFVNPSAVADGTEKLSFEQSLFTLPTLQDRQVITGDDLENISFGDNEYTPRTPGEKLTAKVAQVVVDQRRMVALAIEKMAIEALFDGKITVVGKGENRVLDFGRPAELTVDVGATDPAQYWDQGGNPDNSFDSAIELLGSFGATATDVIGRPEVVRYIVNSSDIKDNLDNRRMEFGGLDFMSRLAEQGVIYYGTYKEVNIWGYSGNYQDADGVAQKAVPEKQVVFVARNNQNVTVYGDYPDIESLISEAAAARTVKDARNFTAKVKATTAGAEQEAIQTVAPMLADVYSAASYQVIQ